MNRWKVRKKGEVKSKKRMEEIIQQTVEKIKESLETSENVSVLGQDALFVRNAARYNTRLGLR